MTELERFMKGVDTLNIPRAEDLPYWTSPPIQFVYESSIPLALGLYMWDDVPSPLTPNRPILDNALYYFRSVTLTADTTDFDFSTNIVTSPQFFMFRAGDARTVLFREPLVMNQFYQQFEYRFFWMPSRSQDQLFAAFRGTLVQGAGLIGKISITLKAIISAQEIVDENFINLFRESYPKEVK